MTAANPVTVDATIGAPMTAEQAERLIEAVLRGEREVRGLCDEVRGLRDELNRCRHEAILQGGGRR